MRGGSDRGGVADDDDKLRLKLQLNGFGFDHVSMTAPFVLEACHGHAMIEL